MNTPRTYAKAGPATWELVRAAYLSGLSAAVVARRFGVTLSALRKRASREGWTKAAYAQALAPDRASARAPAPPGARTPAPAPVSLDPRVLAKTALEEAARALLDGRPYIARAHAHAGQAMAKLAGLVPEYQEAETLYDGLSRHEYMMFAIQELSIELAHRLARGEDISRSHPAAYEAWKTRTMPETWRESVSQTPPADARRDRDGP